MRTNKVFKLGLGDTVLSPEVISWMTTRHPDTERLSPCQKSLVFIFNKLLLSWLLIMQLITDGDNRQ